MTKKVQYKHPRTARLLKSVIPYVPYVGSAYRAAKSAHAVYKGARNMFGGRRKAIGEASKSVWKKPTRASDTGNYGLGQEGYKLRYGNCPHGFIDNKRDQKLRGKFYVTLDLSTTIGLQTASQGNSLWSTSDINYLMAATKTGGITGATQLSNQITQAFNVGTCKSTAEILNQTSTPITLTVYTVELRQDQDLPYTFTTDWNDGYANTPVLVAGSGSTNLVSYTAMNASPYDSPYVTCKYKMLNTKRFEINAGATVKHIIQSDHKKTINAARLNTSASVAHGKMTKFRVYVLHGAVTTNTLKTAVSYGIAEVNIIETLEYEISSTFGNQVINVTGAVLPTTLTNPLVMNELINTAAASVPVVL